MPPRVEEVDPCCVQYLSEFKSYEAEDFKAVKRLGYGDMGTVFLAILRSTGQPFAMKVMNKEVIEARESLYRVERELEILSGLDHPFLPQLFTHFESKKHIHLVMSYCSGGDMNILRQRQPETRFTETATRFYAAEIILAIEHLHKNGVIYRDLKPENVLIQEDGHVMLTDFDLSLKIKNEFESPLKQRSSSKPTIFSKRAPFMCANVDIICATQKAVDVKATQQRSTKPKPESRVFPSEINSSKKKKSSKQQQQQQIGSVRSKSFVGTEEYVSPEIIWGCGHGKAVDWWTLGVLLYEMVYGITPFRGANRKETFYNILCKEPVFPGNQYYSTLRDLISKLLVKDPNKRLGSVNGAEELKAHAFFEGVEWDAIQHVSRPPWVPPPLNLENESAGGDELVFSEHLKQVMPEMIPPSSSSQNRHVSSSCSSSPCSSNGRSSSFASKASEYSSVDSNLLQQQQQQLQQRLQRSDLFKEF